MRTQSIICVARDEVKAVRVLDELRAGSVSGDRISVLIPEQSVAGGFEPSAETKGLGVIGITQARGGRLLAGALKTLVDVGILTRPNLGRVMGAGPLMAALNAPAGFARAEGFAGELIRAGLSVVQAERCESCLRAGKVLLSVRCDSTGEAERIETLLTEAGARDIGRYDPNCGSDTCWGTPQQRKAA